MEKRKSFITLTQFLKYHDFISSGGQAKFFLLKEEIFVNGQREERRGRKLYPGDEVRISGKTFIVEDGN